MHDVEETVLEPPVVLHVLPAFFFVFRHIWIPLERMFKLEEHHPFSRTAKLSEGDRKQEHSDTNIAIMGPFSIPHLSYVRSGVGRGSVNRDIRGLVHRLDDHLSKDLNLCKF